MKEGRPQLGQILPRRRVDVIDDVLLRASGELDERILSVLEGFEMVNDICFC